MKLHRFDRAFPNPIGRLVFPQAFTMIRNERYDGLVQQSPLSQGCQKGFQLIVDQSNLVLVATARTTNPISIASPQRIVFWRKCLKWAQAFNLPTFGLNRGSARRRQVLISASPPSVRVVSFEGVQVHEEGRVFGG